MGGVRGCARRDLAPPLSISHDDGDGDDDENAHDGHDSPNV